MSGMPDGIGQQQITLTLSSNEWGIIRAGLYELPAKVAVPVIGKIERLIAEEIQRQQTPTREATP